MQLMSNSSLSILKQQSAQFLKLGKFEQGLKITNDCIELDPCDSSLYLNKAVFLYKLGRISLCLSSISQSITLDPVNYHAYFNLFSIYMENRQFQTAFKNICCSLSIVHLLLARTTFDQTHIQKAIQFSFNNKEARALRCLQKLRQGKNIEALNQINYALYLDPSHPQIIAIQNQIYQSLGMKELKNLGKTQKRPRFQKLQTCKEIPAADKIEDQIIKLLTEFNQNIKKLREKQVFIVSRKSVQRDCKQIRVNNLEFENNSYSQTLSQKTINIKKLMPIMPKMAETLKEDREIRFTATSKQRESTVQGSQKHNSSIPQTRNIMNDSSKLLFQAFLSVSLDKICNSSVLDLSSHSKINRKSIKQQKSLQKSQLNDQILGEDKDYFQETAKIIKGNNQEEYD